MNTINVNWDTIVAPVTATYGGAVCVIRISGDKAIALTSKFFKGFDISKSDTGRFYYGNFFDENDNLLDEVITYIFKKPKSYTGEDVIEISCHSNVFLVEEIISIYLNNGCRMANPGEFTERAFLNGKMDLLQAEAVADLISAKSKESTRNSLKNLKGGLSSNISELKDKLIEAASLIELDLDFTEEDLEIIPIKKIEKTLEICQNNINYLIDSYDRGRILQKGIEILITGKPNVGKSSLMNALLNKDRVIVSHIPGTTRDMIHEDVVINNSLVRLIDTAGIRFTDDLVEAEGVKRAMDLMKTSDLIIVMTDISEPLSQEDWNLLEKVKLIQPEKVILVGNKIDKSKNSNEKSAETNYDTVFISAKNGNNISTLKDIISRKLKLFSDDEREDIIITNQRHYHILERAKTILNQILGNLNTNLGYEFIASDIRELILVLSEMTGEISSDDILNNIFSNFCIGK